MIGRKAKAIDDSTCEIFGLLETNIRDRLFAGRMHVAQNWRSKAGFPIGVVRASKIVGKQLLCRYGRMYMDSQAIAGATMHSIASKDIDTYWRCFVRLVGAMLLLPLHAELMENASSV